MNISPISKVNYAILSAMPEEQEYFLDQFTELDSFNVNVGGFDFTIYDYKDKKILLAATGLGTTFSASALTLLNTYFTPDYFLVSGTAGAINKNLKIGDVVIAETAFEAEIQNLFSLVKGTPFETCLINPIKNKPFPAQYPANSELLAISSSLNFANIKIHKGSVVSSNAFPAPKELFEKIKHLKPYSIDMETSAFYQIAWLLGIKIIAVRGISNILNSDGTDDNVSQADVRGSSLSAAIVLHGILDKCIQ